MHVGVKEGVAEHLGEKDLDAGARELRDVHALPAQLLDLAHRRAVHPLHGHDGVRAPVPVDLGHGKQRRVQEVAAKLACMRRLAHEVELLEQMSCEFGDDFARLEAPAVGPEALDEARCRVHQREVFRNHRHHSRAQDLDCSLGASWKHGDVHLRDRGARDGLRLELLEDLCDRLAEGAFDFGNGELGCERRHLILQLRQLVGDIRGQEVAARREHLAELDENRAERLERAAQPHAARLASATEKREPR